MKPRSTHVIGAVVIASACAAAMVQAQGRGGEWTTSRGDAQRTSWVRTDVRLDEGRRAEGRAEVPVEDEARQRYASAQLPDDAGADGSVDLASRVQGARVPRRQLGADVRRRHRPRPRLLDDGHQLLVDHAAREQLVGLPRRADRRRDAPDVVCRVGVRRRRRWRPRRPVGELCWRAWKGAPSLALVAQAQGGRGAAPNDPVPAGRGAAPGAPAARAGWPGGGGGGGLGGGPTDNVYVLASDGFARTINPHNGSDRTPAVPFLPANANASGLIFVDGVLYTSTSNNCGAAPNGVWAIDLGAESKKPVSWKTNGGNVAGTAGPTLGTDGTIFVAVGDGAAGSRRLFQFDRCARAEDAEAEGRVHAGWRRLQHVAGNLPSQGQGPDGGQRQRRAALPPRCVVAEDAALRHAEIQQCRRDRRAGDVGERRHAVDPGASGRRAPRPD